nr:hypothetical protein HmN_000455000 [Hymenolepis microstoma]
MGQKGSLVSHCDDTFNPINDSGQYLEHRIRSALFSSDARPRFFSSHQNITSGQVVGTSPGNGRSWGSQG